MSQPHWLTQLMSRSGAAIRRVEDHEHLESESHQCLSARLALLMPGSARGGFAVCPAHHPEQAPTYLHWHFCKALLRHAACSGPSIRSSPTEPSRAALAMTVVDHIPIAPTDITSRRTKPRHHGQSRLERMRQRQSVRTASHSPHRTRLR